MESAAHPKAPRLIRPQIARRTPDDTKVAPTDRAIPLATEHEKLCREAIALQEKRISDLRAAVEFDKNLERQLIEGARLREGDAKLKDDHARRWRAAADDVTEAQAAEAIRGHEKYLADLRSACAA